MSHTSDKMSKLLYNRPRMSTEANILRIVEKIARMYHRQDTHLKQSQGVYPVPQPERNVNPGLWERAPASYETGTGGGSFLSCFALLCFALLGLCCVLCSFPSGLGDDYSDRLEVLPSRYTVCPGTLNFQQREAFIWDAPARVSLRVSLEVSLSVVSPPLQQCVAANLLAMWQCGGVSLAGNAWEHEAWTGGRWLAFQQQNLPLRAATCTMSTSI